LGRISLLCWAVMAHDDRMNVVTDSEQDGRLIATKLVGVLDMKGEDEEDTRFLREMAENATRYISSFSWCESILDSYFGGGVGGIFVIFLFHIHSGRPDVDPWIWIMTGDIPSAYLPVSDCTSPEEAFETYILGMKRWVEFARGNTDGIDEEDIPPVNVPATPEWAEKLDKRLGTLETTIRPFFQDDEVGSDEAP